MNTEEARKALEEWFLGVVDDLSYSSLDEVEQRQWLDTDTISAYALAVHTETCGNQEVVNVEGVVGIGNRCGDDNWYCSVAQQYLPQK